MTDQEKTLEALRALLVDAINKCQDPYVLDLLYKIILLS